MKLNYIHIRFWLVGLILIICSKNAFTQSDNCVLGSSTLLTPAAIGGACSPTAGNTTSGFTDSNQGCTTGDEGDDVWYRFVATSTNHTITVDGAADFDAVVGVYTDCSGNQPSGGACIDANGANGIETRTLSGLTIGNTYYICVYDYDPGGGNYTICITTSTPIITMSTGTTTGCAFIFQDNGGTGSYSDNQNLTRTFCPSSAGQCISAAFTSFDLEDNFDYLSVYDGNSTAAPMILGSSYSPSSPGTITATNINTTGCLTFKFFSDPATVSSGWSANITCATCVAAPALGTAQDCNGAITICGNQSINGNSLGSGNYNDANSGLGNRGCLNNYAATPNGSAEHQSSWYFFSPSASGTIGMTIAPNSTSTDYDWAIWGPYTTLPCPPSGPPLRCSAASRNNSTAAQTGLGNGATDTEEGTSGDGWVSTMNVIAGQKYILLLDNWNVTSAPFNISWQLTNGAQLGCTLLPMELISFTGSNKKDYNLIEWITSSENNNDYFTLERSTDGLNWKEITVVDGAGNSSKNTFYNFKDYAFIGNEINYYRLKQTNFNKEFQYSPVMSVEASEGLKTHISDVYPNPSNQHINFSLYTLSPENIEIQLIDFTGNEALNFIPKITEGKNDISIDVSSLKNGIYVLKITSQNPEDVIIQKMIKN